MATVGSDKRKKPRQEILDWVSSTREVRQELQRRNITSPTAIHKAITKAAGRSAGIDPNGQDTHGKRKRR